MLQIKNLTIAYEEDAVQDITLSVKKGEILGIVGESGSGKTTLLQGILQLNTRATIKKGQVLFEGQDLSSFSEKEMQKIRGNEIGMIFQNAQSYMDPLKKMKHLFWETVKVHRNDMTKAECLKKAEGYMEKLGLTDTKRILEAYPFELSGGMCQRTAIAAALMNEPKLLLADEPTSALDVQVQMEFVQLFQTIKREYGMSMVVVSHNLGSLSQIADTIAVMYRGKVVEYGSAEEILKSPKHAYTKKLMDAIPKDVVEEKSEKTAAPLLEVKGLKKTFRKHGSKKEAVKGIDFIIEEGECVGIVGESGCGKTTTAHMIARLLKEDGGEIFLQGKKINDGKRLKCVGSSLQMVFQDPAESFDPRYTLLESVMQGAKAYKMYNKMELMQRAKELIRYVGLKESYYERRMDELSGGECQRAAIARALICNPKFILFDEATSALDVSVQAQIIELLKKLKQEQQISMLFITHDLFLTASICDRLLVMKDGEIIETGTTEQILHNPVHAGTKTLVDCGRILNKNI